MARRTFSAFVLTVLGLVAGQAQAIPVNYSISGNGIYSNPVGTFTYNAATNQFSNVDIWSLDHFTSARGNSADRLLLATGAMGTVLRLVFLSPLSDAGGTITFSGYERGVLTLKRKRHREGSVTSIVPAASGSAGVFEPGATLLLVLGLAAVFLLPRRRLAVRGH